MKKKIPSSLTFDGRKGIENEECPMCHVWKWLGVASDGSKMCQDCYFKGMTMEQLNDTI